MNNFSLQPEKIYQKKEGLIVSERLESILKRSQESFSSPEVADLIIEKAREIVESFANKDYFVAGIGFGHPFDVVGSETVELEEINRFHNQVNQIRQNEQESNPEGWVCAVCQNANDLPNLHEFCDNCSFVKLRPRDFIKALPDIDIILVVNDSGEVLEQDVLQVLSEKKVFTMTDSIANSLNQIESFFNGVEKWKEQGKSTEKPGVSLPVDFHLCTFKDFENALKFSFDNTEYKIFRRTLRTKWVDNSLLFFLNSVFTFNILSSKDDQFNSLMKEFFCKIKEKYTFHELIEIMSKQSPRTARLFKEKIIIDSFLVRYNSW